MKHIGTYFAGLTTCLLISACTSVNSVNYTSAEMPFTLEVVQDSREIVMSQTEPWEEQMMGYYKVLRIKPDFWQMWYSSWDNKRQDDYSGYLVYAYSKDGKNWVKSVPGKEDNILRGSGHPERDGVVEQDVFIEPDAKYPYQMIYTAKDGTDNDRQKTFVEESKDGIHWINKRVLWNEKFDSQFSVIKRDDRYQIYLRYWAVRNNKRYRTIGFAITDKQWNTVVKPHNLMQADFDGEFPHLYNPGASKISDDLDVLFPTFFNEETNAIKFGLAYVYKGRAELTDINLNNTLLDGEIGNWGIISPGLVPAGKSTYWMYYYATNMVHSDYDKAGRKFNYYRIKIRIAEK